MEDRKPKFSIRDAHYIMTHDLENRLVNNNTPSSYNGWTDPNGSLYPLDFFGTVWQTGIYDEMSKSHPIIAQTLDVQADAIANMTIEICPSGESVQHLLAAELCKYSFENSNMGLKFFIRDIIHKTSTNGHALYELVFNEDKNCVDLFYVRSSSILQFESNAGVYEGCRLNTETQSLFLDQEKSLLVSLEDFPGNYYGISQLRKLLSTYQAYKATYQNFLASQRNSKGFLQVKETGETTEQSWRNALDWMNRYYNNDDNNGLILDRNLEVSFLTAGNSVLPEFTATIDKYEKTIRDAMMDTINNLGMESGSRALGSQFMVSDAQKFAQYVSTWETLLNSRYYHSNILKKITQIMDIDPDYAPYFKIIDNSEQDVEAQIRALQALAAMGANIMKDLGPASLARLYKMIGFEPTGLIEREGLTEEDIDGDNR